ncbi:calsequestrin-2-like [Sphaerodactylus townsendi]|uniref:calsequestrin-2-like n=1 Tax=Sphaerodactylus townsendi TaxID=933632 RepID=UPI00202673D9|nr:calsequestrin-2-like [Sphaerodactylus townsendi]
MKTWLLLVLAGVACILVAGALADDDDSKDDTKDDSKENSKDDSRGNNDDGDNDDKDDKSDNYYLKIKTKEKCIKVGNKNLCRPA